MSKEIWLLRNSFFFLLSASPAVCQQGVRVQDEYSRAISAHTNLHILDPDKMFGDQIGLYTGSLEFLQTDISIPGNNQLEVAIKRRLKMGERPINKMFADWELAIPNIHGVFSTRRGWITSKGADPTRRCSEYWWPYSESVIGEGAPSNQNFTKTFLPEEFWFGAYLYTPDSGDIPVLRTHTYAGVDNGWPRPSNGGSYPLRTRGGAVIRCVPSQDGSSEGFEVTTQDGTSYRLDHLATRPMYPLLKFQDFSGAGSQYRMQWTLPRTEYFPLVTSVKDRFGNTVSYEWDQADPWKLNRITGSDGRALNITYSNGVISQVQDANKPDQIWKYNGGSVIRPDGSSWEFSSLDLNSNSYGEGSIPGKNSICYSPGYPTTKKMRAIMKHPSGAIATFEAEAVLHGRSRTRNTCDTAYNPNSSYWLQSSERNPATYYLWSDVPPLSVAGPFRVQI